MLHIDAAVIVRGNRLCKMDSSGCTAVEASGVECTTALGALECIGAHRSAVAVLTTVECSGVVSSGVHYSGVQWGVVVIS